MILHNRIDIAFWKEFDHLSRKKTEDLTILREFTSFISCLSS